MNKPFYHIFCLIILSFNCFGQDNYIFNTRQLSAEDGLLGRRVKSMVEDNEGFMWIATNEGLNRFDGYRFEHYTKSSHGLNANNIASINVDDEGDIWITYNQDKFLTPPTQVFRPSENSVLSLKEKLGSQYQETFKSARLSKSSLKSPTVFKVNDKQSYTYFNKKVSTYPYDNIIENKKTNTLWTNHSGKVYKVNIQGEILDSLRTLPNCKIKSISVLRSGSILIRCEGNEGINFFYKNINSDDYILVGKTTTRLSSVLFGDGFGTNEKIYFEHDNQILNFDISSFSKEKPRKVYKDAQDNLWIGLSDGLVILSAKKQNFKLYLKDGGRNGVYDGRGIWADNETLFAFSSSGAYRYDFLTGNKKLLFSEKIINFSPNAVTEASDGNLWMGTKGRELYHIDKVTGENLAVYSTGGKQIWSLFEDKNGRIWIGQNQNGLRYFEPDKMEKSARLTQVNGFEDIEKDKTIHIIDDKRDNNYLLLSSQSGWYRLHIKDGLQYRYWSQSEAAFNIPASDIHFTHQDADNNYWVATASSGLLKVQLQPNFEIQSVEQFTVTEGLTSNTIYAIFEDENGYLWMSSNNGIMRFDKETYEVQAFLEEDGLPHFEFNRISHFQRKDGTIFFGTLNGIVSFHPKNLKTVETYDIPIKIAKCEKYSDKANKILNITTEILQKNKIVVSPNDRLVTLYVTLQDYAQSIKTKYAYRIKGLEKDFTLTDKNEITLSGLPYGRFTLEVKGKNYDGRFSTDMISIPLIIQPPFYLRWWFILLFILGLVLIVYQILQARTRFLQNQKRELEEVVKVRTQQLQNQAAQLQNQATQLQIDKNTIENQAEELRSLDRMKSQFFANISHELRTPLTLILSPVRSILKRQKLDNQDYTSISIVEQNAQKLLKRINEILDLTKLEAHEMELKPEPTPFYEFNKRLVATFESLAAQKEQRITFQYQLDKELSLLLDQDKYEHIFNNYLSNAIKFTPKNGQIDVLLSEKSTKNADNTTTNEIVLAVSDNGLGIPKQDISKVFDRFFQSSNNQNKSSGSGIGLSLSKEIALLMKGNVLVKSEVGKGSTFYFEMPYVEMVGNWQLTEKQLAVTEVSNLNIFENLRDLEPSKNKPTILLVEDNTQLRNYIQLILQEKYNVITAENGKVALEWLMADGERQTAKNIKHSPSTVNRLPSAVISDIMMPVMDGFELLKQLKASDKFRHIPVVMLTARSNIKDKLQALRIGVDDYILKPFQEEELLVRIDNLITNTKNRVVEKVNVSSIYKKEKPTTTIITEADTRWLEQIEKRLKAEISNSKFNVESLSVELNISRSKLQRRIKKITGLTPVQYFRDIKLQAARELLENQEVQTINEVAYAVGFDTPAYFTKVFTKHFGKKPIEYLK